MYESFFQFQDRPFLATPVADRYYPAASIEHARETILRCIERAQGLLAQCDFFPFSTPEPLWDLIFLARQIYRKT